jgi:hypothetical protein
MPGAGAGQVLDTRATMRYALEYPVKPEGRSYCRPTGFSIVERIMKIVLTPDLQGFSYEDDDSGQIMIVAPVQPNRLPDTEIIAYNAARLLRALYDLEALHKDIERWRAESRDTRD